MRTASYAYASCVSAITIAVSLFGVCSAAWAQTASQIVRDSYAPPVIHSVEGGLALPATVGLSTPAGAEKLRVVPSGLVVAGTMPALAKETASIGERLTGKSVTGADLFAAARDLETAYARAGYLLVRVSLPPQTIKSGKPLKLVVTDGRVEAIDTSALPTGVRSRIAAVLAPLVGKSGVTKTELERRLLLAGDTPGVMLRSTLKAGKTPGGTIIVVDGRYDAVTGTVSIDDSLAKNLGTFTVNAGVDFNNILGLGDTAYLRVAGYPGLNSSIFSDDPRNRQLIAGYTLPLGVDGAWLNAEGVDSRTHPTSDLRYTMLDHYQRLSTKLGYSWVRGRDFNTSTVAAFDIADEDQKIDLGGSRTAFTADRLRVLRLTQNGDAYLPWGGLASGSLTASFGLDGLGARQGTTALPLSRDGADPDFTKLEVSGRYSQAFDHDSLQFSLAGKAQTSFGDAMASSEQFTLGGFDWLSAFGSGEIEADTGAALRAELALPTIFSPLAKYPAIGAAVAPYIFGAAGFAKLEEPTAVEASATRAASFGTGIRFGLSQKASPNATTLSLEYAHGTASAIGSNDRFNLTFIATF